MDEILKNNIIDAYNERAKKAEEFYECRKYLVLIDDFMCQDISNQDYYSEEDKWTEDIDMMFSFLYENANELMLFNDETVFVEHKGQYLELFEIHGQGCFRRICPLKETPQVSVKFEDIVKLEEYNQKPIKSDVLKLVNIALDSLGTVSKGLDINIDIDTVKDYLRLNLN